MPGSKISVVTPSLNQDQYIEACIRSVLDQDYANFEHIVVDGGSSDGTLEILKKYPHLKWVSEEDGGQTHALNKGFEMAQGNIVAWLNSDDTLLPGALDVVGRQLDRSQNRFFIYGDFIDTDQNGNVIDKFTPPKRVTRTDLIRWWTKRSFIGQPASFFLKDVLNEVGYLDQSCDYVMDWEFWIRVADKYKFHYVAYPFANRCRQPESKTIDLRGNVFKENIHMSKRYWGKKWTLRYLRHWLSFLWHCPHIYRYIAAFQLRRNEGNPLRYALYAILAFPPNLFHRAYVGILLRALFGNEYYERNIRVLIRKATQS